MLDISKLQVTIYLLKLSSNIKLNYRKYKGENEMTETNSIFTPRVIEQINEFIKSKLFDDILPAFDISDSSDFKTAIEDAKHGRTEFEIEIDLDQLEDPDVFNRYMGLFFEGYIFGREYRHMTRILLRIDNEAKTLAVVADIILGSHGGAVPNGDEFVVYDGETILLEDYVEAMAEDYDEDEYDEEELFESAREEFTDADHFDPSSTYVSTVISLEE